ncbi:hypothetical protein WG66_000538 [Moniliophthora roreri]|uniref:Uncharacterized protein n=1 Tax=Moniliophthora roreri TaxID=221103 RepID=A0A0W0GC02_MONRR|nr:hypothetical protein WG66_000538 [Moniliophthora roreri]
MIESSAQRTVPGAPPSAPVSKSQLKKLRKAKAKTNEPTGSDSPVGIPDTTSAALVEKAPEPSDIQQGAVTPALVAQSEGQVAQEEDDSLKPSLIVELVNKRLKTTNKKIIRISSYATADPGTLNDDQKRTLKTLPTLEAIVKELSEVKKAIESHESELARELAEKRQQIEATEKQKIEAAVAATQASSKSFTPFLHAHLLPQASDVNSVLELLSFVRLRHIFLSGERDPSSYGVSQREVEVISASTAALLGEDSASKEAIINGFISKMGSYQEVPYERLLSITQQVLASACPPMPSHATPTPQEATTDAEPETRSEASVAGAIPLSKSGSFHFLQESEIETTPVEQSAEWVEHPPAEVLPERTPAQEQINGHIDNVQPELTPTENIDWAAEGEDDLPSIDGLHATFGKSGSATPNTQEPQELAQPNGHEATMPTDDDGFTQARGGRGRGRGFRSGERGGFRGGFRGGERGRGGDRGFRGRGGSRGRGEWRGEGGEYRGRGGRGRGRGGDRGGASPALSTSA